MNHVTYLLQGTTWRDLCWKDWRRWYSDGRWIGATIVSIPPTRSTVVSSLVAITTGLTRVFVITAQTLSSEYQ
jgi:hypothetical protein